MTTTTDTTNAIITFLNMQGHLVWRNSAAHVYGAGNFHKVRHNGVGDIVGTLSDGTHIEIEVKTGKDRIRPEQQRHGDELKKRKALYFVAKSFDDFERQWKGAAK
jgi:hypothetical protein